MCDIFSLIFRDLRTERDYSLEKRGLAVDFVFCLIMIEILKQVTFLDHVDGMIILIIFSFLFILDMMTSLFM